MEVLSCLLDADEQCWSTRSKNDRTPLHSAGCGRDSFKVEPFVLFLYHHYHFYHHVYGKHCVPG